MNDLRTVSIFRLQVGALPYHDAIELIIGLVLQTSNIPVGNKQIAFGHMVEQLQTIFHERYVERDDITMARRPFDKSSWTFANIRLTPEQRSGFTAWSNSPEVNVIDLMGLILQDGYKMSVREDTENSCWLCTLTGTDFSPHNKKVSMTSRHNSLEEALLLSFYKHLIVSEQGAWATTAPGEDWG